MKFKNIKKKTYVKKSPSNSRTITEALPKINALKLIKTYRLVLKVFVALSFLITAFVVGYDLQRNLQFKKEIEFQRESLMKDLNFWESFVTKNKNYPDAYFQTSILEYKLGNTSKAKMYAEKGLVLDPSSENGRKIEEFLKNKFYF